MYKTINVKTHSGEEFIDITNDVQKVVNSFGVKDGICVVFVPHTTAGITINEGADPSVRSDILMALKSFKFESLPFRHAEGNSPSHTKASLTGSSETIIIESGRLVLGTWQAIYFCEYDGPRNRKTHIKVIGS